MSATHLFWRERFAQDDTKADSRTADALDDEVHDQVSRINPFAAAGGRSLFARGASHVAYNDSKFTRSLISPLSPNPLRSRRHHAHVLSTIGLLEGSIPVLPGVQPLAAAGRQGAEERWSGNTYSHLLPPMPSADKDQVHVSFRPFSGMTSSEYGAFGDGGGGGFRTPSDLGGHSYVASEVSGMDNQSTGWRTPLGGDTGGGVAGRGRSEDFLATVAETHGRPGATMREPLRWLTPSSCSRSGAPSLCHSARGPLSSRGSAQSRGGSSWGDGSRDSGAPRSARGAPSSSPFAVAAVGALGTPSSGSARLALTGDAAATLLLPGSRQEATVRTMRFAEEDED